MRRPLFPILLTILALAATACDGSPTAPGSAAPTFAISDGAHAGNGNFFWAPPLAPNASSHLNWDDGNFNGSLAVNADVCELDRNPVDFPPSHATPAVCVAGPPRVHFGPEHITISTTDEQYQVNWNTDGLTSTASGFFRLYVYVGTLAAPGPTLGFLDLDPVDKGMKNMRTGEVVAFQDGRTIPVKFRIERGVLCPPNEECTEETITKGEPGETEVVQFTETVNGVAVPIGGVEVPTEAFPEGVEQLTFRIRKVETDGGGSGFRQIAQQAPVLCHPNLEVQQFDGCFEISTVPELPALNEAGDQFRAPITVAVCFELHDTGDPREDFVQLWATDDGVSRALPSASAEGILTNHEGQDCGDSFASREGSNALVRLASSGLRVLARGFGHVFGVKSAYAVDRGLGGLTLALSTIGPALTAEIEATSSTEFSLGPGIATNATVQIVGTTQHGADAVLDEGIANISVTFALAPGNGTLFVPGTEGESGTLFTVPTNAADEETDPGFASIGWLPPSTPGVYILTASGPARGGPITFTATVSAALPDLFVSSGAPTLTPSVISTDGGSVTLSAWTITNQGASFTGSNVDNGFYLSTDPVITAADLRLDFNSNTPGVLEAGESFNWGGPSLTLPPRAAGTYYVGILVDEGSDVAESNEGNNYVSSPITYQDPVTIDGVLSAGEWDDATVYGPFTVNFPEGSTTATLRLKNTSTNLYMSLQFADDLSNQAMVIAAMRMDENDNGAWDNREDGFVAQQRIGGERVNAFFDEFFSCDLFPELPCQGRTDNEFGGTVDGVTASTDSDIPTVIEIAKGINTQDERDAALTPGQILRFFIGTNIGPTSDGLVNTTFPTTGWGSYTVR